MDANKIVVSKYEIGKIDNSINVGNKLLLSKSNYDKVFEFYSNNFYLFYRHIMMFYKLNRNHYYKIKKHCFKYNYYSSQKLYDYNFYYKNKSINLNKDFINKYNQLLNEKRNYDYSLSDCQNPMQLKLFDFINRKVHNQIKVDLCESISIEPKELNIDKSFCVKSFGNSTNLNPYDLILDDWDSIYSKNIIIFEDKNNELLRGVKKIFVVDGHHRFDLAVSKRITKISDVLLLNTSSYKEAQRFAVSGNLQNSPTRNLDVAKCYNIAPYIFDIDFLIKNVSKFNIESFLTNSILWEQFFKIYINDDFVEQILNLHK